MCWLRDGADPLVGDTTSLSLEPDFPPATPTTTPGGSSPADRTALRCAQKPNSLEAGGGSGPLLVSRDAVLDPAGSSPFFGRIRDCLYYFRIQPFMKRKWNSSCMLNNLKKYSLFKLVIEC